MRETLVIRLNRTGDAEWRSASPQSPDAPANRGTLDEALAQAKGRRIILLVPAEHVLLTHIELPIRNRNKLLQAAPYAVEDQLAEDIDALHFAMGSRADGNAVAVAVVARARMEEWLTAFREHALEPAAIVPDVLAVPLQPAGEDERPLWSLLPDGEVVLVRCSQQQGFAADADALPELIRLAAGETLPRLTLYPPEPAGRPLPSLPATVDNSVPPAPAFSQLLRGCVPPALNLLQGRYASARDATRWWQAWRLTAALAVICLLLFTAVQALTYQRLGGRVAHLQARAEQAFHRAFPDIHRIVDMRAQGEQALAALEKSSGGATFAQLLSAAAQGLAKVPSLHVRQVTYEQDGLSLSLRGPNLQALDALRRALAPQAGITLDVRSANAEDRGVTLEVRVQTNNGKRS